MRTRSLLAAIVMATLAFAGCLSDDVGDGMDEDPTMGSGSHFVHALTDDVTISWAPGAFSSISNQGTTGSAIDLPFGWLAIDGTPDAPGGFSLPDTVTIGAGENAWFIAPPRDGATTFTIDTERVVLDPADQPGVVAEDEVVRGENVYALSAYQEEHFPHREPCHPDGNYAKAIDYFAAYFEELGMDVEVDPYGLVDLGDTTGCQDVLGPTGPASLANVVATLPGTDPTLPTIFVAGGHFDMVPATTHAAFDDTSGTVATLELARAMSQFEWRHTLKFGLWGGEENGILGSQFWVQTHPEARATVTSYWNLDVVGMSWPAPLPKPDPHVIAAGPDAPGGTSGQGTGPIAQPLLEFAQELQTDWFGFPTSIDGERMFIYEGVASGQASGYAGVNAQSDHTPFMAAGIPAYFIFNGDTLSGDNPIGIHNERDTLANMTLYSYFGGIETDLILDTYDATGEPYVWDPEEFEEAKQVLADSWEAVMWFPFYSTVLQDIGYWYAPGPAGQAAMAMDTAAAGP